MKSHKLATIVGEKTAGAMLSATPFTLTDNYTLILPIADYYTADKLRLDQVGVEPDIEVASDKALEHVIGLINLKK
jgi:C-terminal processing protease CtpA/Prc